jgi:hypothetical protein
MKLIFVKKGNHYIFKISKSSSGYFPPWQLKGKGECGKVLILNEVLVRGLGYQLLFTQAFKPIEGYLLAVVLFFY